MSWGYDRVPYGFIRRIIRRMAANGQEADWLFLDDNAQIRSCSRYRSGKANLRKPFAEAWVGTDRRKQRVDLESDQPRVKPVPGACDRFEGKFGLAAPHSRRSARVAGSYFEYSIILSFA